MQTTTSAPAPVETKAANRWAHRHGRDSDATGAGRDLCLELVRCPAFKLHPDWSRTDITLTFSIALVALGVGAITGGTLLTVMVRAQSQRFPASFTALDSLGPDISNPCGVSISATVFSVGSAWGWGISFRSATLIKWFPDKRGMITGLAVAGFGGGAVLTTLLVPTLLQEPRTLSDFHDPRGRIFLHGGGSGAILQGGPRWLRSCRVDALLNPNQTARRGRITPSRKRSACGNGTFFGPSCFLNVTAGVMIISQAAPMTQEITGVEKAIATSIVIYISILNGVGRLFWAWLSDAITRRWVFLTMFLLQSLLFLVMPKVHDFPLLAALIMVVALCYGGGFGTMPAFAADYFGPKYAGRFTVSC